MGMGKFGCGFGYTHTLSNGRYNVVAPSLLVHGSVGARVHEISQDCCAQNNICLIYSAS
jgi:hypothetical protein